MIYGKYENGNLVCSYEIINGRAMTTIMIDGRWVSNPTVEMLISEGYVAIQ